MVFGSCENVGPSLEMWLSLQLDTCFIIIKIYAFVLKNRILNAISLSAQGISAKMAANGIVTHASINQRRSGIEVVAILKCRTA